MTKAKTVAVPAKPMVHQIVCRDDVHHRTGIRGDREAQVKTERVPQVPQILLPQRQIQTVKRL